MYKGILNSLDSKIYNKITFKDYKTKILKIITNIGSSKFIIPLLFILYIVLTNKRLVLLMSFIMLGDALIIFIIKRIVKRNRPNVNRIVKESSYSYPSGHALTSVVFFIFLIYLIVINSILIPLKIFIVLLFTLLIYIICYSRIYLGVHFFSDIIAGCILGLAYILIWIFALIFGIIVI